MALAANAGWRWWHNRPPFRPGALALESSLELVGYTESREALGQPVYYAPSLEPKVRMVLGRVSWRPPPGPFDGSLMVVLIDKRFNRLPTSIEVRKNWQKLRDRPDPAFIGSSGSLSKVAQRYPWLRGIGDHKAADNEPPSGYSVIWAVDQKASPLTFVANFPSSTQMHSLHEIVVEPVAISDLLLAVVCIGPDGQIFWAHRLHG
ncbi:hypothetical protein GCM10023176_41380 [Micromonospora coerulea]|uniref:LssY-like C-terminal domain-containing protein n=1 Tax=Micromonospora coerulea TaxID=47856 RepID=A0ABP8SU56_9ACTN